MVAFLDAGAYTLELMNPYNARPTAGAFAVTATGELALIRRRDTDADLVADDSLPASTERPATRSPAPSRSPSTAAARRALPPAPRRTAAGRAR